MKEADMKKTPDVWAELAKMQAEQRKSAEIACSMSWKELSGMSTEKMKMLFIAICQAGGEYDKRHVYRRTIIRRLPDLDLIDLVGLRMPAQLAGRIDRRLRPAKNSGIIKNRS
jgi:hypothetical protein